MKFNWHDLYISFTNLESRKDRLEHMEKELERVGLKAERFNSILTVDESWNQEKYRVMFNRGRGAIGCHLSQVEVMKKALELNKSVLVLEDDVIFSTDIKKRLDIVQDFLNEQEDWDIFWLGGTYHIPPVWHKKDGHYSEMTGYCNCELDRDWEETNNKYIRKTFGIWSTYAYIVNVNSIQKIIDLLDLYIHESMGIDWLMIKLQPQLNTFCFNAGMAKQYDNQSSIATGVTRFSHFSTLGEHWFSDKM